MKTLSNSSVFRKVVSPEIVFKMDGKVTLCNPREDSMGQLYVCNECGELINFEEGNYSVAVTLGGMLKCVSFTKDNSIFIADLLNQIVYEKILEREKDEEQEVPKEEEAKEENPPEEGKEVIKEEDKEKQNEEEKDNYYQGHFFKEYCGVSLKGPSSLALSKDDEYLIVTDSGYFGSSTVTNPCGSIYLYDTSDPNINVLRPIILNTLAYPCDTYYDPTDDVFYICEMLNNRILRLVQNPKGIFHCSVFHTFNGKLGPSAIAMDEIGNLYVARSDYCNQEDSKDNYGIISILNKESNIIGEILVEKFSEINGLLIPKNNKDETQRKEGTFAVANNILYFTDKNYPGVLKIKLSVISQELEKLQEKYN